MLFGKRNRMRGPADPAGGGGDPPNPGSDNPANAPGNPPGDPPPDPNANPPPQTMSVPADTFEKLTTAIDRIGQRIDQVEAQRIEASRPPLRQEEPVIDVPDDDYYAARDEATRSGDWSKVREMDAIRRAATEERAVRRIRGEIDPKLQQGVHAISHLTQRVTKDEMEHYDVLKPEIEEALSKYPPEQRMNPDVIRAVYNHTVGENSTKLIAAKQEEWLRNLNTQNDPTGGGSTTGRGKPSDSAPEIPHWEEALDPENVKALKLAGKDGDRYAQGLGYKDFSDWYTNSYLPYQKERIQ